MGLGGTAKKIQKLGDVAEKLYAQVGDLREKVSELHERVETTTERLERVEAESRRQRALIQALAEKEGIDVDEILASVEADIQAEASDEVDGAESTGEVDGAESTGEADASDDDQAAEASAGHEKD